MILSKKLVPKSRVPDLDINIVQDMSHNVTTIILYSYMVFKFNIPEIKKKGKRNNIKIFHFKKKKCMTVSKLTKRKLQIAKRLKYCELKPS